MGRGWGGGGLAEAVTTPFKPRIGARAHFGTAQGDPRPVATCRLGYRSLLDPSAQAERVRTELEARLLLWGHFPKACCVPDSGVRGCGLAVDWVNQKQAVARFEPGLVPGMEPAGSKACRGCSLAGAPCAGRPEWLGRLETSFSTFTGPRGLRVVSPFEYEGVDYTGTMMSLRGFKRILVVKSKLPGSPFSSIYPHCSQTPRNLPRLSLV